MQLSTAKVFLKDRYLKNKRFSWLKRLFSSISSCWWMREVICSQPRTRRSELVLADTTSLYLQVCVCAAPTTRAAPGKHSGGCSPALTSFINRFPVTDTSCTCFILSGKIVMADESSLCPGIKTHLRLVLKFSLHIQSLSPPEHIFSSCCLKQISIYLSQKSPKQPQSLEKLGLGLPGVLHTFHTAQFVFSKKNPGLWGVKRKPTNSQLKWKMDHVFVCISNVGL